MSQKELDQLLTKLQTEVEDLKINQEEQQELNLLISEIKDQIDVIEEKQNHHSLLENIRTSIGKFEVEHPRITNILSEIMIKLSNIGI